MMHMCSISQWVVLVSGVCMTGDGGNKSSKAGVVATVFKNGIECISQKQVDLGDGMIKANLADPVAVFTWLYNSLKAALVRIDTHCEEHCK